jgi:hypothetical protein
MNTLLALITLLEILIFSPAVKLSCLALRAVAKLVLSVGCQAISEKDTCGSLFTCNNQSVPS